MNVLIAVPWDQKIGGIAFVVGHLANHLQRHDCTVLFLHPAEHGRPRRKVTKWGFSGYEANLRSPFGESRVRALMAYLLTFPFTLAFLYWLIIRHRIDVVNVHFPSAMFGYFAICRRLRSRLRLVVSIHGTDLLEADGAPKALDPLTRALLRTADAIVAPSAGFAEQCELRPEVRHRVEVIHNGVDAGEFSTAGQRTSDMIMAVASLDHWKGLDVLIHAVGRLHEQDCDVRLIIAGEGPERSSLESLAARLGIEPLVSFIGFTERPALARLLATCAVFVLPSRSEPFGIAVLEALAAAAPVIASRVGGVPEILENGAYGVLVPPDDVPALTDALAHTLRDSSLRARLSKRGPDRARSAFPWSSTGERYLMLYRRLVDAP